MRNEVPGSPEQILDPLEDLCLWTNLAPPPPVGSALGSPPFLQACFPRGWEWGAACAEVRAPFQSVGFPPGWGCLGGQSRQRLISGSLPCFLPTQAPALEKPGEAWRSSETCPSAAAWTLEVGRLRPLWGARLSHQGKGGAHMLSLPPRGCLLNPRLI